MALIMSPMFSVALSDVDMKKHAGSAKRDSQRSAAGNGGSIGTALLGLVFFTHLSTHAPANFTAVEPTIRSQLSSLSVATSDQN